MIALATKTPTRAWGLGLATPMSYWSNASGRQFVVIAAGGHDTLGTKQGDSIVAYALPGRL